MKLLIFLFIGCLNSQAVISLVTHSIGLGAGGCCITTTAVDTTGANLIVLVAAARGTGASNVTVTDQRTGCASPCNTWTWVSGAHAVDGSGTSDVNIFYSVNPTVGAGHTFTVNSLVAPTLMMEAFSGAGTTLDQKNATGGTGTANPQPGSITPTSNGELLICGIEIQPNSSSFSLNNSFVVTDSDGGAGGARYGGAMAWVVQNTAAAINPTWTLGASSTYATGIVSFSSSSPNSSTQIGAFMVGP